MNDDKANQECCSVVVLINPQIFANFANFIAVRCNFFSRRCRYIILSMELIIPTFATVGFIDVDVDVWFLQVRGVPKSREMVEIFYR